jgi:putative salt-induced outer membrane protein YdiY
VCILTLFAVSPVCAQTAQETDVLLLRNGDELTGELKGLQRGQVTYKTDGMSTIYVKWPRVITATTDKQFEIHLEDGRTYFGSLKASDTPHRLIIRSSPDTLEVPTQSVVQLTRLGSGFWRRLSGSLSLGFDFTQQNSKVDLSTSATVAYAIELHRLELTFNGSFSRQDEASTISRRDLDLWWTREYSKVWFWSVAGQLQENSQLSLDFSVAIGTGPGRIFINTNRVILTTWIGPFYRREIYEGEDPRTAVPLALATDFELFSWAGLSTDLSSRLVVAPVLNDAGRWQINFTAQLKREILNNFYLTIGVSEYFDSDPPTDANKNDFSLNTSFSWTFGSGVY